MGIGKFDSNETKEATETNENENIESKEDSLESPEDESESVDDRKDTLFSDESDSENSDDAEDSEENSEERLDTTEDLESGTESEGAEEKKESLFDKIKKLFAKGDDAETNDDEASDESSEDQTEGESGETEEDVEPQNQILDNNDARRAKREEKLDAYDKAMNDALTKHGEMLNKRTDMDPTEKMEEHAEYEQNYKEDREKYKAALENDPDLKDLPEEE